MGGKKKELQLTAEKRKEIAQWIVDHPNLTVKQIAVDLSLHYMQVYRVIAEFLDIRRSYKFKVNDEKDTSS